MVDIVLAFNTGFYKKGYLVMKRREIVKNYLKTWFVLDILASFPYSWLTTTNPDLSTGVSKTSNTP